MKIHRLIAIVVMAVSVHAGVPIARTVDVSATIKPVYIEAFAGETLDLSMQLSAGGAPLSTPSAAATIYWQTNGMAGAWWQTNLSCSATGLVSGQWQPSLPSGRVWFFVGVESSGLNYRISGQCSIIQSPGGSPSTVVLPPPGGTLNLGDYTIIGAPWITSADSASAIASATDPIAADVAALSSQLSASAQASSNYTASVARSVSDAAAASSNYTDSVAAPLVSATDALNARIDSLAIPDVSGLASKSDLQSASNSLSGAIQGLSTDLGNTSNALAQTTAALAQTVADNAQQAGYNLAATSNALAQTTAALAQTVADNAQQAGYNLAAASNALAQTTAALAQTVADNAQQAAFDLVATSNALATSFALSEQLASTALQPSATNALAARIDAMNIAFASSNTATRLSTPDGSIYQDATGVVWGVEHFQAPGLFYVQKIEYFTNGVHQAETNAMPAGITWTLWEGYDNGTWEILAGEIGIDEDAEARYREWDEFTNHVAAADMDDSSKFYYILQMDIAGEETELTTSEAIDADTVMIEWPMSNTNVDRYIIFERTNVTATILTPIDRVMHASEASGAGISSNDVKNIVTNEVTVDYSPWTILRDGVGVSVAQPYYTNNFWRVGSSTIPGEFSDPVGIEGTENDVSLTWIGVNDDDWEEIHNYVATRHPPTTHNALGLAKASDVEAVASEAHAATVTNAAQASTLSNHSSRLSQLTQTVGTWETYWDGDEVRVTVTNYDSSVHLPSLYLEQKLENTNAYRVVWDERTRWASNDVQMAAINAAIDEKADRAWGFYDSHTGYYAPDGYTWLSSPKIAIAGGLAYQRTLTNDGAVWVLASNGLVAQTVGDTNGFFRITDDEGNTTFEIVRGNKRTVGATADGIRVTRSGGNNIVTVPYNVVSDASPTIYGTSDLTSGVWTELSATWTGHSGAWTAQVSTASAQYFIKGEYETGGETYIKNVAPISAEGGIYCTDGIHKVRPVYNNGTITWEVVQ